MNKFSRSIVAALLAFAAFAMPSRAAAGTFACQGYVTGVVIYQDGQTFVSASWNTNQWTRICNVTATLGSIPATTCQNWEALATTAVASNRPMIFWLYNANSSINCSNYNQEPYQLGILSE